MGGVGEGTGADGSSGGQLELQQASTKMFDTSLYLLHRPFLKRLIPCKYCMHMEYVQVLLLKHFVHCLLQKNKRPENNMSGLVLVDG